LLSPKIINSGKLFIGKANEFLVGEFGWSARL